MKIRPWIIAAVFVWTIAGTVALATYSGQTQPQLKLADAAASEAPLSELPSAPSTREKAPAAKSPKIAASAPKTVGNLPAKIQWNESFEDAMQRAKSTGKPVMIDFYTDWCGPCKMMEQSVYTDKTVIAESANWVTVKVNGDKRADVMQQYGIDAFPTIVFAGSNGKPVGSSTGYVEAPEFAQIIQDAYKKWSNVSSI